MTIISIGKNKKGSVLIFTLFIMMISLVAGIGIISVVNLDTQSSLSTAKTVNSFQVADTGLERALYTIKGEPPTKTIGNVTFFNGCSSGDVAQTAFASLGTYTITFWDSSNIKLMCSATISEIKTIKSVGTYEGTSRAVEVTLP